MPPWMLILLGRGAAGEGLRPATRRDYRFWFGHFAFFPIFFILFSRVGVYVPNIEMRPVLLWGLLTSALLLYALVWVVVAPRVPVIGLLGIAVVSWSWLAWMILRI